MAKLSMISISSSAILITQEKTNYYQLVLIVHDLAFSGQFSASALGVRESLAADSQ